jgi:putative tryptophan/tyrosine transport system substrate-binding protein
MDRRAFAGVLAACLLAARLSVHAQQAARMRRIGVMSAVTPSDLAQWPAPLVEGLRELGWSEGQNLIIERRPANSMPDRLPALAAELVALNVDVIVTMGTPAALAARNATSTIPIVMASIFDPVRAGLVASLARPGGNVTGNSFIEPDLGQKRLQVLKEMLPAATRIGEFNNPSNPALQMLRQGEEEALRRLGMQAIWVDVSRSAGLEAAFTELVSRRAQALVVHSDGLFSSNRVRIMELALAHGLPTMAEGREFVEAGAVLSYAPNLATMIRGAAVFIDKIFKGAAPADLPVQQPTRFELVINLKTAKALGLTIPQSVLLRADELIQ